MQNCFKEKVNTVFILNKFDGLEEDLADLG